MSFNPPSVVNFKGGKFPRNMSLGYSWHKSVGRRAYSEGVKLLHVLLFRKAIEGEERDSLLFFPSDGLFII